MNLFIILLSCFLLLKGASSVKLDDITVPQMVVLDDRDDDGDADDDNDHAVLDCDYKLESSDFGSLVVKWYKDNNVMYQWIRGKAPSVFAKFTDKINESYQASDDPNYKHKAILLENLSTEDSGMYKCVVQTIKSTLSMEKRMQIIDVSNSTLTLTPVRMDNETHVQCTVENVYPMPKIIIMTEDDEPIPIETSSYVEHENGFFTGSSIAISDNDQDDDDESFKCIIEFGNLPFNLSIAQSEGHRIVCSAVSTTFALFLAILPLLSIF